MSFKNKIDASFEEIIRLVTKVISGTGADSLFGFRTEVTASLPAGTNNIGDVDVLSMVSWGKGAGYASRSGALAATTAEVVTDQPNKDVTIESLEVAASVDTARFQLDIYNADGTTRYTISASPADGTTLTAMTFSGLRTHKSGIWELVVDAAGTYKARLTRALYCPNGFRARVENTTAGSINMNYQVLWAERN